VIRSLSSLWLVAALAGCSESVDMAAKRRIFSPEDPPRVVSSALEKVAPDQLADSPELARRVLEMGAAEATERVGAHKYAAQVTLEWTGNGRSSKVVESRTVVAGPGGVSGDFHATVESSSDQGLEVLRTGHQVYARSRYGKFRQRLRDRGMAEKEREEIYGALRDFHRLFQRRLVLKPHGAIAFHGRSAHKYEVTLGEAASAPAATEEELPALLEAKGGADEGTLRRRAFFEHREPKAVRGELLVDAETSVVLRAKLDGRIVVPKTDASGEATLRMMVDATLSEIGREAALKPPKDFLPDQDKPSGIADALARFGLTPDSRKPKTPAPVPADPEDE
jgi:hypothetical protein